MISDKRALLGNRHMLDVFTFVCLSTHIAQLRCLSHRVRRYKHLDVAGVMPGSYLPRLLQDIAARPVVPPVTGEHVA